MTHIWPTNHQNRQKLRFQRFFGDISVKIGVKHYPNSILRPYLESSHQGERFRPPVWKRDLFFFSFPLLFSKFYFSCANRKKRLFMGEKWHFVIHIPWHRISSENPEKVEFAEKWNALLSSYTYVFICWPAQLYLLDRYGHTPDSVLGNSQSDKVEGHFGHVRKLAGGIC